MYRTWVIIRHTFTEAVLQPIFTLMLLLGAAILGIFGALPFFTFGEDTMMFKTVSLDVLVLVVLISTLFVTSRSIYEEIEDRTMLTLMSKPVQRWEVMLGKYLGIILAAGVAVLALGIVLCLALWFRIPTDYQIRASSINEGELRNLWEHRWMHINGIIPSLLLSWLEIAVLAAIGVAISTRFSLVFNLPAVILIYVAGNLARFAPAWNDKGSSILAKLVLALTYVFPFLEIFDLRRFTVLAPIAIPGTQFAAQTGAVSRSLIWENVGYSLLYAVGYIIFVLAIGLFFFRDRELGGAEG